MATAAAAAVATTLVCDMMFRIALIWVAQEHIKGRNANSNGDAIVSTAMVGVDEIVTISENSDGITAHIICWTGSKLLFFSGPYRTVTFMPALVIRAQSVQLGESQLLT